MRSLPGSAKAIRDNDHLLELFGVVVVILWCGWLCVGEGGGLPGPLVATRNLQRSTRDPKHAPCWDRPTAANDAVC